MGKIVGRKKDRSPVKEQTLRHYGQSLDEEFDRILNDEIAIYLIGGSFLIIITVLEWWRWYKSIPPNPLLYSLITLLVIPVLALLIRKKFKQLQKIKQGRKGERFVGQALENLRGL